MTEWALDADGSAWSNTETQPLDNEQGTGILDLARAHAMYSAGEQTPDSAPFGRVNHLLGTLANTADRIDVTLVWDRHTFWNDSNGTGQIDAGDSFVKRLIVPAKWGTDPGGSPDFNGDGIVDIIDLLKLLGHWGLCP